MNNGKVKLYLLYIFTFGMAYFSQKAPAKKLRDGEIEQLTLNEWIGIAADKLVECLGSLENVVSTTNTISSIKFMLIIYQKLKLSKLKN